MNSSLYAVILAGGKGERFWPLSTPEIPKPFLKFFSDRSLLQQTYDRALRLCSRDHVYVVVGEQHETISREQLPELPADHLLLEPTGRDTAAAIGYASLHLPEDALMLVLPADHLIPDTDAFVATMERATEYVAQNGGLATFGVLPDRPETNYGYVKARPGNVGPPASPIFPVEKFVEKPDRARAEEYVRQGSYYWNSGMFLWKAGRIRELIAQHLPQLWEGLTALRAEKDPDAARGLYGTLQRISIDFGVMEKAEGVVVVPAAFGWDDIGTWNSLLRVLAPDAQGNLVWGNHTSIDTTNCIIHTDSPTLATAGLQNLIVVQKDGKTLICTREYADRLKELLAKLKS